MLIFECLLDTRRGSNLFISLKKFYIIVSLQAVIKGEGEALCTEAKHASPSYLLSSFDRELLTVIPPSSVHSLDTITCQKYIRTDIIIFFIPFYVSPHQSHTLIPTRFLTFPLFSLLSIIRKISCILGFFP